MAKTDKVFDDRLRVDLFAGFPVSDYSASATWYEHLLGCPPAFLPNDVEAVWELAEHRYIFIKFQPENAGHAFNLFFLSDIDRFIAQIAERGLNPTTQETLSNGVRRITYSDPDGSVVGFGGAPQNRRMTRQSLIILALPLSTSAGEGADCTPSFRGLSRSRPIFSIKPAAAITHSKLISGTREFCPM